ncbi:hypothetical protein [Prescottella subtropica]|uniref:hypothetical protein n=1 Tax=Prescottella subtropica TaxID=2545757 RepID=UPI001F4F3E9A|nr:hypothetical protein [Prescottella subtropica]
MTIGIEARPNEAGVAAVRAKLGNELAAGLRRFSRRHQLQSALDGLVDLAHGFTLGVGVGPARVEFALGGQAATGDLALDLEELIEAISEVMKKKGTAFGLFIDEMQDLDADLLSALLAVQHRAVLRDRRRSAESAGSPRRHRVTAVDRSR